MRHIIIIILLYFFFLTFPLVAQETGILYLNKVNGKLGWFENSNDKKDWKYVGDIKDGKPNGIGELSSTFGSYFGGVKMGCSMVKGFIHTKVEER